MTIRRIELFGISFSDVTFEDVCQCIDDRVKSGDPGYIVTPNVDHVCLFDRDPAFRQAYSHAFLVLVDGVPVVWASRLLGEPLRQKLSGSDMVPALSEFAAQEGYSVFLLGAAEGIAAIASARLQEQYPALQVVGAYAPPMGFYDDERANTEVVRRVRESGAQLCFVALGAPEQVTWMYHNCESCGTPVMIGVGAGLDFVAGHRKRAPLWMQRTGLEWVWRLIHEPRRLWRRYLIDDLRFLPIVLREFGRRRRKRASEPQSGAEG